MMKGRKNKKLRIKDIAKLAGVSTGTVDRVIHARGQVSEENVAKIKKLIDELNYSPNLLARSLATKRNFLFVTLFPEYRNDKEYWGGPIRGVEKACEEFSDFNIQVQNLFFDQYSVESYRTNFLKIINLKPDAVLVSPVFREETIRNVVKLNELNIPYVFIDSNIEEINYLAYFGQHSYQSGYLAAKLLHMGLKEHSDIAVIKPYGDSISNQVKNRENGFKAFFEQNNIQDQYNFLQLDYIVDDEVSRQKQFDLFFKRNSSLKAGIVFNSKVYDICNYLEKSNFPKIQLIGYDLLIENADYLRKGIVTFLIAQRPEEQGYKAIMTLFNHLVMKQEVQKINYVPIDILTKENLDFYLNF